MRVVYVTEDDEDIREIVLYALQGAGYETHGFENGAELFAALCKKLPDMILLDIMLPGRDGLTILKELRDDPQTKVIPVIMLTAKGSEIDKVKGLDLGADDYIPKPFGVMELISRVNAVLRRSKPETDEDEALEFEDIRLDTASRTVSACGDNVHLTFKEYELLFYLIGNKGKAMSRDKILLNVWGDSFEGESRTLDIHISSLRHKLGQAGKHIKTVRNVGYKIGE